MQPRAAWTPPTRTCRLAQDKKQVAPRLDVGHGVVAGFQADRLATVSFGIVRKRFELETARTR